MSRLRLPTRLLLFAVCGLACAVPGSASAARHHAKPAKQQIADLEEEWKSATLTNDVATLDRLLSDDFVGISWTGQVNTKAIQIDRIGTRKLDITRLDLSEVKIKVIGSVAIVTSRADVIGTNDGAQINGAFLYTRIYQRQPSGAWKITNFEATRAPRGPHPDATMHPHRQPQATVPMS